MLTNFEHFYLSLQQFKILEGKILLLDNLDSNLLLSALVHSEFDNTILAFSQVFRHIIKIIQITVSNRLLDCIHPPGFFILCFKVIDATFVGKDQHEGEEKIALVIGVLLLILYVDTTERLHLLVFDVALILVTVELFTQEHKPILL